MDNMNRHKMSKQTLIHGKDRGMVTLVDDLKTIDKATQNANADRAKHDRAVREMGNAKRLSNDSWERVQRNLDQM